MILKLYHRFEPEKGSIGIIFNISKMKQFIHNVVDPKISAIGKGVDLPFNEIGHVLDELNMALPKAKGLDENYTYSAVVKKDCRSDKWVVLNISEVKTETREVYCSNKDEPDF